VSHSRLVGRPDLLDHERDIPSVRATERTRALTRARAALVAGLAGRVPPSPPARWAAVGVGVWLATAGVGVAAYQVRAHFAQESQESIDRAAAAAAEIAASARPAAVPAPSTEAPALPAIVSSPLAPSRADVARTELRLLRQARAAVAREDYAAALPPIAEHARRFKNGRLTEEREALRVKALAGVGRVDEAQRVADAFRTRFSTSVLLPVIAKL
jgi:hypothetical protein